MNADKARIAFVIDTVFQPAGGTENQLLKLIGGLDRARFEPTLFCLRPNPWLHEAYCLSPWQSLDTHVSTNPLLLLKIASFARRLRRGRFDLVQTHFRDANLVGVLAAHWAGTKVIVSTRRGVPYWESPRERSVLRLLNRSVDCFLANSEATRDRFAREEGFALEKSAVIYNGLDPAGFSREERAAVRAELAIETSAPAVGIVANLRPVKGLEDFVRAAAHVVERRPEAQFLIVGTGQEEARLRSLAAELGLGERLRLLGARSDVPRLLATLDVGVLASHFESFPNAVLEYLATGLPVVSTDVGGVREAVEDGVDGFIVPPKDPDALAAKILDALKWPSHRAIRLDERFQTESMISAHEALYSRLLGHSKK